MSSILLLGNGITNHFLNQIALFSPSQVKSLFAGSLLEQGYNLCKKTFSRIYLANVKNKSDYLEVAQFIDESSYDYICPLDLYVDEQVVSNHKKVPAIIAFCDMVNPTHSLIILSDLHATAFYNQEQFIEHYNRIGTILERYFNNRSYQSNIILIANHFKKTTLAQVAFAIDDINSAPNVYLNNTHGNSYYSLAKQDFYAPIVFIKNHTLIDSAYENLLNFSSDYPDKMIMVHKIKRFIEGQIHYNVIGKRYTGSIMVANLESIIRGKLDKIKGVYIEDYAIEKIDVIKRPVYYEIIAYLCIVPYLYTEQYHFTLIRKVE